MPKELKDLGQKLEDVFNKVRKCKGPLLQWQFFMDRHGARSASSLLLSLRRRRPAAFQSFQSAMTSPTYNRRSVTNEVENRTYDEITDMQALWAQGIRYRAMSNQTHFMRIPAM